MDHFFIYRNLQPVRVTEDGLHAFIIERDGSETPTDAYKVAIEGKEVSEAVIKSWYAKHPY